jgi:hypothetical protein
MTSFSRDFGLHRQVAGMMLALCLSAWAGTTMLEPLRSADPAPTDRSDVWWRIAPYGWLPATTGEVGILDRTADVDISMSDTLENLDLSAMLAIEAGKGPWSLGLDGVYGAFSGEALKDAKVSLDQAFCRAHLARDLTAGPDFKLTLLTGVRYTSLSTDIEFRGPFGVDRRLSNSVDWFDPVAGLRAHFRINDRWFYGMEGDIGGFSVESDLIWQAHAHVGVRMRDGMSALLGYRGLGFDREGDRSFADLAAHGPYAGLIFEF